ncbi:hypothetical protein [Natronorubrum halophilum]|uniref:hypothetical protein n=1 Tax=Natronorubrum halophilum TaxID=1702106 RepID=UPI0010C16DC1|nr:hypothetical protein [Natronorubrum halophilum]
MSDNDPTARQRDESAQDRTRPDGDRTDHDHRATDRDLEHLAELVDDLEETSTALIEHGAARDIPAIEHNARRIRDTVRVLAQNVPRDGLESE